MKKFKVGDLITFKGRTGIVSSVGRWAGNTFVDDVDPSKGWFVVTEEQIEDGLCELIEAASSDTSVSCGEDYGNFEPDFSFGSSCVDDSFDNYSFDENIQGCFNFIGGLPVQSQMKSCEECNDTGIVDKGGIQYSCHSCGAAKKSLDKPGEASVSLFWEQRFY